ncbi:aminotransferase class I/II-fold pyridoxal phosphate-dependent enzyme [Bacillus sp. 31A1R]|uniref:Aminotransferase class I/II-fold pyridoxal phosphate-dependent enzyme n=1 Tax=Robertmurraya mangrovi TaxID=3098077 RepID=A0ABU5J4T4_9BACI|nr:aminotransferase class I/II-fold pyridoxal phosphate-dependent enzyme [Bacillus sp. 31A1R]MDZ5474352.1 aminotransferase class I/II-fold pyridoxal phosphate-dependent enzyme [Bacillus sp. 31A1R]
MKQNKTPIYQALIEYDRKSPVSLHVPGHKNGVVFPKEKHPYFDEILRLDATEITGLDDLHEPENIILEAEQLLADLYKVKDSFLLINGSTVGNLAMILATIKEDETVLVQRNCHKSILNGIHLAKANPVFLGPNLESDWGVAGGISLETVQKALELHPNSKAIILTYPNYYGMVYELEEIIKHAHSYQIPVLVDEAHGAHFIVGTPFPKSAVQLGADVVVQSAHKTLPAMTMGSFLHVNSEIICTDAIKEYLSILQSSSPSYTIMASLDISRSYLGTYTNKDLNYLMYEVTSFREQLKSISEIKVMNFKNGQGDPLKITIQSTMGLSGYELQQVLEEYGIYTELADPYNVLFVLPLLKEGISFPFKEIVYKVKQAVKKTNSTKQKSSLQFYFNKSLISTLSLSLREREKCNVEIKLLKESLGFVCAESIIPYPPGIPILLPGERISNDEIESLSTYMELGAKIQGGKYLNQGKIKVYTDTFVSPLEV